jgi:hypothetical protein
MTHTIVAGGPLDPSFVWPPISSRTCPLDERWAAVRNQKPRQRLFRLVDDRPISDEQKWRELCAELHLESAQYRNGGDVLYALKQCQDLQ